MLVWLCDNLDLPLLRELEVGVEANAAARALLERSRPATLVDGVQTLVGARVEGLRAAIGGARVGRCQVLLTPAGTRILCTPDGPGRAAAIIAPTGVNAHSGAPRLRTVGQPSSPPPAPPPSPRPEATGTLDYAAGVSHELANTLGAIAGWARLARGGERVPEALELIERSAESAWSTARQFLSGFSGAKRSPEPVGTTDLSTLVHEAAQLIGPQARAHQVVIGVDADPHIVVKGERGAHWSVLWNLATNAVEAMPNGGTVELTLRAGEGRAWLSVEDTGPGMSRAVQAHIFDPYFTTKPAGAGIGLPFVKRTIVDLGGHIACHSQLGRGTRFDVRVPLAQPRPKLRPSRDAKRVSGVFMTESLPGNYLVVDDDPALRDLIATALQMRGATVTAVSTGEEALQAHGGPFTAVVVDLLLSDERGDALISALRQRGLAKTALLITGTELPGNLVPNGAPNAVLRKPFDLDALFEALANMQEQVRVAIPASRWAR